MVAISLCRNPLLCMALHGASAASKSHAVVPQVRYTTDVGTVKRKRSESIWLFLCSKADNWLLANILHSFPIYLYLFHDRIEHSTSVVCLASPKWGPTQIAPEWSTATARSTRDPRPPPPSIVAGRNSVANETKTDLALNTTARQPNLFILYSTNS